MNPISGNTEPMSSACDLQEHMEHGLPYLCELADAIHTAGFLGVYIQHQCHIDGPVVGFRVVPTKLAGHAFEGVFRQVAAGGSPPPIASVLMQLEAANAAIEKDLAEHQAMNGGRA